jgi:LmbE family N-acetylglucosaminyl deacetylase
MPGIPTGPLLLLSPHVDDAVFSCAALVERAEPIDVVTVFAGAPEPPRQGWWDAECGFSSSVESAAARLAEDEAAFAGTPHARTYLDLLELQYVDGRTGNERSAIGAAIRDWVTEHPSGTVALPACAGCDRSRSARLLRRLRRESCSPPQHPDHLLLRDAGLEALRGVDATPLLYEEVPYLWGGRADRHAERAAASGGWRAEAFDVEVDRRRKAERVAAYASQIAHISPQHGRLDEETTLPARERYWRLARDSSTSP